VIAWTVPFLFGAMVALLLYTRVGGLAVVAGALAILVFVLAVEAWREVQLNRSRAVALRRLEAMRVADAHRKESVK
jgi:hypothetical protein